MQHFVISVEHSHDEITPDRIRLFGPFPSYKDASDWGILPDTDIYDNSAIVLKFEKPFGLQIPGAHEMTSEQREEALRAAQESHQ